MKLSKNCTCLSCSGKWFSAFHTLVFILKKKQKKKQKTKIRLSRNEEKNCKGTENRTLHKYEFEMHCHFPMGLFC